MMLPADSLSAPTAPNTAPKIAPKIAPSTGPGSQRLRQAAESFTAVALGEMLSPMFATLDETGGLLGGGAGEAAFRPMLIKEMAAGIARHGGLGLTDQVAQAMLRLQESKA
jgi:Rod binding domain-containing protein